MLRLIRLPVSLLVGVLFLLQGCGFHLRGSYDIPPQMNPIYIDAPAERPIAQQLKLAFMASDVVVSASPAEAKAILRILNEKQDRQVRSVDSRGKVIDYELTYEVDFEVLAVDGETLVPRQSIHLISNQVNADVEVLGKQEEQAILYQDMRNDVAYQLLQRVKTQLR